MNCTIVDEPAWVTPDGVLLEVPPSGCNLDDALTRYERHLIMQAVQRTGGNKAQAARLLNTNRTTLVEKMKRLGVG